jgi:hypothetical protein
MGWDWMENSKYVFLFVPRRSGIYIILQDAHASRRNTQSLTLTYLSSVYLSCTVRVVSKEAAGGKDLRRGLRKLQITTTISTFPLGGVSVSSVGIGQSVSAATSIPIAPIPFNITNSFLQTTTTTTTGGSAGVLRTSNPPFGLSTRTSARASTSYSSSGGATVRGGASGFVNLSP